MVFSPLADWKVRLLIIGMLRREVDSLLGSCQAVERRSDWMTRPPWHRVLYWDKTSSIVTNQSCHHCAISHHHHAIGWWIMRSNCYWIGPSLSLGVCQVSVTLFSSCDLFLLCFIISSLTLCHMPLFLFIIRLILFPWRCFPFVLADSFVPITHFISLTILPIFLTLFLAFVSYCCSIYGSHVCGASVTATVLYLSCIR